MRNLLAGLGDMVFPPQCMACDAPVDETSRSGFCTGCRTKIRLMQSPLCTCCGIPFQEAGQADHPCGPCLVESPPFTLARSVGAYEGPLLEAIHRFKYEGKTAFGEALGGLMAEYDYPGLRLRDYSMVIPVPLHVTRLRERGFNQAVILARQVARRHALPLDFLSLKRLRPTPSQIQLGRRERVSNVRGAFALAASTKVGDQRIILVDDVFTTGSTLGECARALLKGGASAVAALTLARAVQ